MTTSRTTRRAVLRRSGAALLAVGAAAGGGCIEALPPLGQRVQYGRVDAPAPAGKPAYRRWLPAASALPDDLDPGYVDYATPGRLGQAVVGVANPEPRFFQKPCLDYFGHGYEAYDAVLKLHRTTRPTYVLLGEVDPERVSRTLRESGYASAGSYAGYDRFERPDGPRTAAVSADAVVWSHHDRSGAVVEAVIDAERGAVDRHHEVDAAFARATDAVGPNPWTEVGGLGIDPTGDALVRALSYTFDADGVYYLFRSLYPDGEVVSERALRDALEGDSRARAGRAVDVRVENRTATVEIRLPHESVRTAYADAVVPQITWGVIRESESLTVRHAAGETAPAGTLTLYVQDEDGYAKTDAQFDGSRAVAPGDSVTVDAPDTSNAERLAGRFSAPDAVRSVQFVVPNPP